MYNLPPRLQEKKDDIIVHLLNCSSFEIMEPPVIHVNKFQIKFSSLFTSLAKATSFLPAVPHLTLCQVPPLLPNINDHQRFGCHTHCEVTVEGCNGAFKIDGLHAKQAMMKLSPDYSLKCDIVTAGKIQPVLVTCIYLYHIYQ